MINLDTVKFIMMIDTITQLSANGVLPFSEIRKTGSTEDCVYYDETTGINSKMFGGTLYKAMSVALDADDDVDEAIYWDEYIVTNTKYSVSVIIPDSVDETPYVMVACEGQKFFIQNGECLAE